VIARKESGIEAKYLSRQIQSASADILSLKLGTRKTGGFSLVTPSDPDIELKNLTTQYKSLIEEPPEGLPISEILEINERVKGILTYIFSGLGNQQLLSQQ